MEENEIQSNNESLNKDLFQKAQNLKDKYFSLIEGRDWKENAETYKKAGNMGVEIISSMPNGLSYTSQDSSENMSRFGLKISGQNVNYGEITFLKKVKDRINIAISQSEDQVDPINLESDNVDERREDASRRGRKILMHNTNKQIIDVTDITYYVLNNEGKIAKLPNLTDLPKPWSEIDLNETYEQVEPGDLEMIASMISGFEQRYQKLSQ